MGYTRFVLGGTRHFGYYEHGTWWPFPLSRALLAMEDKLAASLGLAPGGSILTYIRHRCDGCQARVAE